MLPHPIHRARSRQSTSSSTTTNPTSTDSLQSWSMAPGHSSSSVATSTSVWSDDGATVLPSSEEGKYQFGQGQAGDMEGERPLIELDSDPEPGFGRVGREQRQGGQGKVQGTKPSEELRRLLRQMEEEVKCSTPAPAHSELAFSPIKRPTSLPSLPPPVRTSPKENVSTRRANWREGRRIGVYPPARISSPEREREGEGEEEEEESPPTPPLRLTKPYLHSARKVSDPGSSSKTRISSRAAVLQNSASRSPPPEPAHSPTPLETFIATHPVPPHASSSRSPPSRTWSRKGKERESNLPHFSNSATAAGRRSYTRRTSTSSSEADHTPYRSSPEHTLAERGTIPRRTPRRYSIEIAPDDSELFERDIEGLEVRGEVELDEDEDESGRLGRPWSEEGGSGDEGDQHGYRGMEEERNRRSGSTSIDRTHRQRDRLSPNPDFTQSQYKSPNQSRSKEDSSRLSKLISAERSADVSLPYVSGPESEDEAEEPEDGRSDRRAALFRSGSRSRGSLSPTPRTVEKELTPRRSPGHISAASASMNDTRMNQERSKYLSPENASQAVGDRSADRSKSSTSLRNDQSTHLSPSPALSQPAAFPTPPIRVGLTLTSPETFTPQKAPGIGETTIGGATPHPPGWLSRSTHTPPPVSAGPSARSVRFSPLRKTDKDWSVSMTNSSTGEVSVHKLKVSPGKRSPAKIASPSSVDQARRKSLIPEEGDTSFTSRLTRFFPLLPFSPSRLPKRSTTLQDATPDLDRLRLASEMAQVKMEESKAAWTEALLTLKQAAGEGSEVMRMGMGWGGWAVWIGLEVLLLWGVFRVTLDYALSLNPSSNSFQTLNLNPHALSTRLPAALSAFVVPKHSANFFDLMEKYEVWRRVESVLGADLAGGGGGGVLRIVAGGVPS